MSFNLEESSKNVVIITNEDSTSSSKNEFKSRRSVDLPQHAFQLVTNRIVTDNPTTNGFQTSTLDFTLNIIEPSLILQNFDLLDDNEHKTLAELKIIYQKMDSFLKKKGLTIESGSIREVIFADNDLDEEFTFLIEVVLKNVFSHAEIFKIEEELWDYMETDETIALADGNTIEIVFSVTCLEGYLD